MAGALSVVRAAICREYGPPEVIEIGEFPLPALEPGQVRVGVEAASVNFPDVLFVANEYQFSVPPPFVPGSELAGIVLDMADDVRTFQVGDRVFGTVTVGAFAEEIVLPARSLTALPDGIAAGAAAAFGVAHRTAYHVLRSVAAVQHGQELVVLGAGGGVGLAAVQLGVLLGATVTAVASSNEKLAVASECGATHLVNHRTDDLRQALKNLLPKGADVVIDPVGGELAEPALRCLHYGGRFVTVGYASGIIPRIPLNLVLLKGMQILGFQFIDFATHRAEELERNEAELLELLGSGRVSPHIGARFSLDEAAAALRYVADGRAIGKVLLDIG
ncbi:MAG TPA: NADPH:quinone oxidoreductase family protein [Frankiaceae bacterium]|nr:NADPH:quinone oxidoreductase family protein [Frankiaceae bacterium]